MYHVHTTPAFVVSTLPSGERNQFITLFTRDFGMIRAKAQSIRVPLSKMKYALQEYSYTHVSLVKGKEIWRIVNAQPLYNVYFELKDSQEIFMPIARIISLLKRLLPEEGCESAIFDDLHLLCESSKKYEYEDNELKVIEWYLLVRAMCSLGYAKPDSFMILCDGQADFSPHHLNSIYGYKDGAVNAINVALKASQL